MVFEGGANRTVFSCGVMDAFLEEGLMPDYLIGVSAGIAYGVSYLSGQKGRNIEVVENYIADKRYMGMRHLFNRNEKAYFNTKFVFEEVPNELIPFDYDAFAAYPGKVEAAVTNIHTGKAEYVEVPRGRNMRDTLVASCSLPILFQPVKLGRHYYLDGGLADSIPIRHALHQNNEKIVVILTRNPGYRKKAMTKGMAKLYRRAYGKYPEAVKTMIRRNYMYNKELELIEKLEHEGRIFVLRPLVPTVSRLEQDCDVLREFYEHGYHLMKRNYENLMRYLEI